MITVTAATCSIAALATLGVVARPWNLPEYIWAAAGAVLLVVLQLLPWQDALAAAGKGLDVYFFLIGMMLLAEVARQEGLFDWLAVQAVRHSRHSASRLFSIVYAVGTLVTIFLSNDATAVVLTPAVYAAARAAKVEPLPYLLVCAFIANAASFVLPISNPANLVVFGDRMPTLLEWLRVFSVPSLVAILATFVMLRFTQRRHLRGKVDTHVEPVRLTRGAAIVAGGIALTAVALLASSAFGHDLGLPTLICGALVTVMVLLISRKSPLPVIKDVSWSVLPLVAGLFVLVEGLNHTGLLPLLSDQLRESAASSPQTTAWAAGLLTAFGSNLVNNLPMGLIAATTTQAAQASHQITGAVLIGVDLGPNLSVTGSLATILWLIALRREGEHIGALRFLRLGVLIMTPALVLALAALMLMPA
ncbi:arsenic transporter [Rhodopseudomonas palustris]|uniref:Arsenic transporter n=1 Tax=Rhodopseudomonas palustris TaxID=1076 RepID=A0A418VK88_RHOPL|nr:arsenic transporter [Rhodopseudomonas palustris]RJF76534.1 arsenic transporter [Rhodopseudomonas palustris]